MTTSRTDLVLRNARRRVRLVRTAVGRRDRRPSAPASSPTIPFELDRHLPSALGRSRPMVVLADAQRGPNLARTLEFLTGRRLVVLAPSSSPTWHLARANAAFLPTKDLSQVNWQLKRIG